MSRRGMGTPKSEEERSTRHRNLYTGEKLPPRGTGIIRGSAAGSGNKKLYTNLIVSILIFAFVSFIHIIFSPRGNRNENQKDLT